MTPFKKNRLTMLVGVALATGFLPAYAQQAAATSNVGNISVEGRPGGADTGLIAQEETPKARSSVSKQHLENLVPTSGAFQTIELLPGVNSFSQDGTGLFGGGIRVRGFAGDQMGLTINGAPVNDSGNFAVYPQEYTDNENLCEVFITQGSTDSDAPHVGASGGNIGMVTCAPKDAFGMRLAQSFGGLNYRRSFVRLDTAKIGESGLKGFISYSKTKADKFKGSGNADRDHVDVGLEFRPSADLFFSSSLLYNNAINNNIRTLTNAQIAQFGRNFDFGTVAPQHLTPVAGVAQSEATPTNGFYKYNVNPFRNYLWTAKAELKVNKDLTVSAEPYFWDGFGTGGGQLTTLAESNSSTKLGQGVRDINGDGDTLDTVMVYGSSVTKTKRPGITFKANYRVENHNLTLGYWTERAEHRQTGPRVTFDNAGNSANPWLDNSSAFLLRQDGSTYQQRDWLTITKANSLFAQDTISLMQDKLQLQLGLRQAQIKRDFTNTANDGSTSITGRSDGNYTTQATYNKLLPSVGAKYNISPEQSAFVNVAQNFRAPSNFVLSNLLQGGSVVNGVLTGATLRSPNVGQEESTNLDIGYRYQSDKTTFSGSVFLVNFKNRIARAYDPSSLIVTDYNVGDSTIKGFELESGYKLNKNLALYGSLTYTDSKIKSDLQNAALPAAAEATAGKQFPDTPKWMAGASVNYSDGPVFGNVSAKLTGKAFSTLVNDETMSGYTVFNLMAGYRLPSSSFFKTPQIRLNVANLFNKEFLRINSPSGSSFTVRALGTGSSLPSYYVSAPRFASITLQSDF
jgi:iron complex outermembrane receptor protein